MEGTRQSYLSVGPTSLSQSEYRDRLGPNFQAMLEGACEENLEKTEHASYRIELEGQHELYLETIRQLEMKKLSRGDLIYVLKPPHEDRRKMVLVCVMEAFSATEIGKVKVSDGTKSFLASSNCILEAPINNRILPFETMVDVLRGHKWDCKKV